VSRFEELPTAVLGDFNTFSGGHRKKMFELMEAAGFVSAVPAGKPSFKRYMFVKLRLDWIWLKGLEPVTAGIANEIQVSDHRPLWVDLKVDSIGDQP
jgi:endonuclease/exonuclease/phosphatase (EEP) superfamily protein YafD